MPSALQLQVVRNVLQVARTFRAAGLCDVPDLVHLAVTLQESSWNDQAVGDTGQSFGPYQIYQVAHPNTEELAISPWANYAFHICAGPWQGAWGALNGAVQWANVVNRGAFLESFGPAAQRSDPWTVGTGNDRYVDAVRALELVS